MGDVLYGLRRLRNSPGFSAICIVTLALGIGASTAMFSAAKPVLFDPLPYPHANRIATIWDRARNGSRVDVAFGTYLELRERSRSFETLAVMRPWQAVLTGGDVPERLEGQFVSVDYFRALGIAPAIGRDFTADDDRPNGSTTVIISDRLWKRRFGANQAIVGTAIILDGAQFEVVGVMPSHFENVLEPMADIWRGLQYDPTLPSPQGREWGHHLRMVGRVREGVTIDQTRAELAVIAQNPIAAFTRPPFVSLGNGLSIDALQDDVTRDIRPALLAVLAASALLLIISIVNVTSLLVGLGAQRAAEFAMRMALGAGRWRLTRQLLIESLAIAAMAAIAGVAFARIGVDALRWLAPPDVPRLDAIVIDRTVLAFAFGLATFVGVVVGLMPALQAARRDQRATLQPHAPQIASSPRIRSALVIAEVALATILLAGAGLMVRSLQHLFGQPVGFDPGRVLTMEIQTAGPRFRDAAATERFFKDVVDVVRNRPGVEDAAVSSQLPMTGSGDIYGVQFESSPIAATEADQGAFRYAVSPDYFATMSIPIRRGRGLNDRDTAGAPLVALISESFAKRRFGDQDPIGQRMHIGPTSRPWFTVVGVAGDVRQSSLAIDRADAVYVAPEQWHFADQAMWLVVKGRADPAGMTDAIKAAIWSVDKDQPIIKVRSMSAVVAATEARRRFVMLLFETFGLIALVLAATGVYGVLSSGVAERTRELGVRTALGASRANISGLVLRQGLIMTTAGLVLGLGAAIGASAGLRAMLFGVSRLDPITYIIVAAVLIVVSAIACWLPAWQAARIDPVRSLRAQ